MTTVLFLVVAASALGSDGRSLDPALQTRLEASAPDTLADYRLPTVADLTGDWARERRAWRADADFNGDEISDTAVLLPKRQGTGYRLLVLLGHSAEARVVVLEDQSWAAQGFGLGVVQPGRYKTAAGKGYSTPPDDPLELTLSSPAVDRFHFESWNGFWYWVPELNGFRHVQMSD